MKLTIEVDKKVIEAIRAYYNKEIPFVGVDNGKKLLDSVYAAIKNRSSEELKLGAFRYFDTDSVKEDQKWLES